MVVVVEIKFGHGYNGVLKNSPLGISAHNDFFEIMYNYGIVGFIPYLILHIQLMKQVFASIRVRNEYAAIIAFTYTIFFIMSMISIVILYPLMALIAITWGMTQNDKAANKV